MLEFDLTSNEDLDICIGDLRITEVINILIDPKGIGKAYHLIKEIIPYCLSDVLINVSLFQESINGVFFKFSLELENLSIATLNIIHSDKNAEISLCKLKSNKFDSRSVDFKSDSVDVKLSYTSSFDILRRFPLHMNSFYEQELLDYIVQNNNNGIIVDVGANIGNHSVFLGLKTNNPIYAFEPRHDTFVMLQKNVKQNSLGKQINCFQLALGDQEGTLETENVVEDNSGATKFRKSHTGNIPVQTLDSFFKNVNERLSVIKIDVEGMETQVLDGARATLMSHKPVVFAEALDEKSLIELKNKMSELNYRYIKSHCETPMIEFHPG